LRFNKGVVFLPGDQKLLEQVMMHADIAFWKYANREALITCGREGKHSQNSRHYWRFGRVGNFAVDLRTWVFSHRSSAGYLSKDVLNKIAAQLRRALGDDWDIVIEATHIHCEYDPKDLDTITV
jgi:hypothetical protein